MTTAQPPKFAAPINGLPDSIITLFEQAFVHGQKKPTSRPSAQQWQRVLKHERQQLLTCQGNKNHHFYQHLAICPWCGKSPRVLNDAQMHQRFRFMYFTWINKQQVLIAIALVSFIFINWIVWGQHQHFTVQNADTVNTIQTGENEHDRATRLFYELFNNEKDIVW